MSSCSPVGPKSCPSAINDDEVRGLILSLFEVQFSTKIVPLVAALLILVYRYLLVNPVARNSYSRLLISQQVTTYQSYLLFATAYETSPLQEQSMYSRTCCIGVRHLIDIHDESVLVRHACEVELTP